jgi:hypothetical protein
MCSIEVYRLSPNSVFIFEQLFEKKNGGVPGYFQLPTVSPSAPTQDKTRQLNSNQLNTPENLKVSSILSSCPSAG